jgi:hypothetical protein
MCTMEILSFPRLVTICQYPEDSRRSKADVSFSTLSRGDFLESIFDKAFQDATLSDVVRIRVSLFRTYENNQKKAKDVPFSAIYQSSSVGPSEG